jgi:signal transduction histidine kinase
MAAGVTHDLRNILNPMSLYTQVLERSLARGDYAEAAGCIAELKQVLRYGLEVIDRLRDFSRQSTDVKMEPVDLSSAAREAARIASSRERADIAAGRIVIVEELGQPPKIQAQSAEIVSALVNLVVNAIDAMPGGGTVTLRTGERDGGAWIEVADDGPGMTPEVEQHVFEPFFSTKGGAGTGLGLSMVYACITRHQGTISLRTAPGRGATFTAWFPCHPGEERAPQADVDLAAALRATP